jgi:hypothetical protein
MLHQMPQIYRISKFAHYNTRTREACSIYKIDRQPTGALGAFVKSVDRAKSRMEGNCSCVLAIKNPEDGCEFVQYDTLPVLLSWLTDNGYTVLPSLSEVAMRDSNFMIQEA